MKNKIYPLFIFFFAIFTAIIFFQIKPLAEETNTTQKTGDVVVISNPKTPEQKMRIVFNEELSIGEVEGDENYMFGENIFFNTDKDGNFYVSDVDAHRIQKYDPDGKYLLTIGREGQGPGEFGSLSLIRFDKDSNIYIDDEGNNRISFFNKDGEYLRQIRLTERYSNPFINSKDFIIANKFTVSEEGNFQIIIQLHGLFDSEFNMIAELFKDEMEMPLPTGVDLSAMAEYIAKVFSMMAFRPQVITTVTDNDFIYLGYPDKYEINVFSPEGELVKKITREYDPIPVSEKDKESFVQLVGKNLPSVFTEDLKEKAFKNIKYPKFKPAYQGFTLMENGWLCVIVNSVEDEYTLIDLFDQEGEYIAHFKTPIPAEGMLAGFLFFNNGKAYSVVTEDDYKFVKRYSIAIQEFKGTKWIRKK